MILVKFHVRRWLPATALTLTACASQVPLVADEAPRLAARWPAVYGEGSAAAIGFGLPELDAVLTRAQAENLDMRTALARIEQARATARVSAAGVFPSLTGNASTQRNRQPGADPSDLFGAGGTLAYEVDLWGRNRSLAEGGRAALASSEAFRDAVRLSVQGDTATAWFQLLSINDRIVTAQRNVATSERLLGLIVAQKTAGRVSALEVARQRNQVAVNRAALAALLGQRPLVRNALAILTGQPPDAAPDQDGGLRQLNVPQPTTGEPAELLARRPDIRQAELDLVAAKANLAAARAAILPRHDLSVRGALQSAAAGDLLQASSGLYALAASLTQTVFDGGRLEGQAQLSAGIQRERLVRYLQVVLQAQKEVADALANLDSASQQEQAQREAAAAAAEALALAELRFAAGAEDYSTVLDAQRTVYTAETAIDIARLGRFSALVALSRALAVRIE